MPSKCPLCGQSLPHALTHSELQTRIQKLSSPALAAERAKLKADYDSRRKAEVASEVARESAALERQFQSQLRTAWPSRYRQLKSRYS
jgi:DNA repair exonuclease SbcCD ATPase subunit